MGAKDIVHKLGIDVSIRTVERVLHAMGWLHYKKRSAAPSQTPRHQKLRLNFAFEYEEWESIEWAFVVFSDEKKWNLDGPNGMRYRWVDTRRPEQVNLRRHSGGGSVMIWTGFAGDHKTEIKFLSKHVDAREYRATL